VILDHLASRPLLAVEEEEEEGGEASTALERRSVRTVPGRMERKLGRWEREGEKGREGEGMNREERERESEVSKTTRLGTSEEERRKVERTELLDPGYLTRGPRTGEAREQLTWLTRRGIEWELERGKRRRR